MHFVLELGAQPALELAEDVLQLLAKQKEAAQALANLRKSPALLARLRPSEAKNNLMDTSNDFIQSTRHKLAAWHKSMQRLSSGEGIVQQGGRERMAPDSPLALALIGNSGASNYLSIIQLVLGEMVRLDGDNASQYAKVTAQVRRCSTILSDCEIASDIQSFLR
ncbi:MAG: hypothetical protein EBV03_11680 [Proteobacteria bacterium]|nr:hypothetical protein [Pseudomonadota bacterium]